MENAYNDQHGFFDCDFKDLSWTHLTFALLGAGVFEHPPAVFCG